MFANFGELNVAQFGRFVFNRINCIPRCNFRPFGCINEQIKAHVVRRVFKKNTNLATSIFNLQMTHISGKNSALNKSEKALTYLAAANAYIAFRIVNNAKLTRSDTL